MKKLSSFIKNHMRVLIICLTISCLYTLKAQNQKDFNLSVSTDIGYSSLKLNGHKNNMSTQGAGIEIGYNLNYVIIESGIFYNRSQTNYISKGESAFLDIQNLKIPLGFMTVIGVGTQKNDEKPKNIGLLLGLGIYSDYYFKIKADNLFRESNVGWNLGMYSKFGIHLKVNQIWGFNLGIKNENGFGEAKKDALKIKNERTTMFLCFEIYL